MSRGAWNNNSMFGAASVEFRLLAFVFDFFGEKNLSSARHNTQILVTVVFAL
jgi:hypothetical protein